MYFFKQNGKQHLDLTGDLILSQNDALIKARVKSIAPVSAKNAQYILVGGLSFFGKLQALLHVADFLFGKSQALTEDVADLQRPIRKGE